tara:strand:+ start:30 stop:308 length:279 start_codon:yes stop_codon:yes gene_type:complete
VSFKSFKGGVMNNVVDINKLRVDAILRKIKKQEDLIAKARQSPLISLAELAIYMFELRIEAYKQEIQKINEAAFGKEFMQSKDKGSLKEYRE